MLADPLRYRQANQMIKGISELLFVMILIVMASSKPPFEEKYITLPIDHFSNVYVDKGP